MRNLIQTDLRRYSSRLVLGMFALALIGMGQYAQAQSSATFRISESASVLKGALDFERNLISQAEYDTILMDASCQNPASRLQARNRPYIMVQNTSTVADAVTSIVIDLTRPGFEFGNGDVVGDGFNGLLSMLATRNRSDAGVALTSASYVGNDTTQLQLNFSGLTQGRAAIFRFDIDEPGALFDFPDYRVAIQGADRGNGTGSVATFTTTFQSGPSSTTFFPLATEVLGPGHAENYHAQTMVPPPVTNVPEPTSAILLLSGVTAVTAVRRRRR